jgi:DNA-binding NarL/FixJ family response regulator
MSEEERAGILARYAVHAARFDAAAGRQVATVDVPGADGRVQPSRREVEILALIAVGMTNPEIGRQLFLSLETIKTYIARLLPRIGARNRAHAVAIAIRRGWIVCQPESE